ncbi:MAG: zinc-ribbon domain-containing protein [Pelagibacterales bacterium]|nr:zinc-ribbon domain-containing protein [Pelagibacterales bacterium]
MIIIFGNAPKYFVEAEGKFICPNCNFIKRYLVKTSKDYFRLFFTPLVPLSKKSQPFVECQHCKNTW